MKKYISVLAALILSHSAYAFDLKKELKNAGDNISKELQKSKVISTKPNYFNREVNEEIRPKPGEFWMAVLGDSSATGAASSANFQATWLNVLTHITDFLDIAKGADLGPDDGSASPFRVMYSEQEFKDADHKHQALELRVESDLSQKVDTEEYSFGYALTKRWNLSPNKLLMTGQDGVRISSIAPQFQRVMTFGVGTLPPLVLMSFVANDLCHPNNFINPVETFRARFEEELRAQFETVAALPAAPGGTRVVFLAPLDVANVLTNPALLQQRVKFEGGAVTCEQLRSGAVGGGDLGKVMKDALIGECRGVLEGGDPAQRLEQLRALQVAQSEVIQKVMTDFNAKGLAIHTEYAPSLKEIAFQTGDVANDCFHPSRAGAERIADQLLTHELSNVKP